MPALAEPAAALCGRQHCTVRAAHALMAGRQSRGPCAPAGPRWPAWHCAWQLRGTKLCVLRPALQGAKRTKLGLREFTRLGAMLQEIDLERRQAVRARTPVRARRLAPVAGWTSLRAACACAPAARMRWHGPCVCHRAPGQRRPHPAALLPPR